MEHSSSSKKRPGEFELIARLHAVLGDVEHDDTVIGIGDDAAAVRLEPGVHVMTTDTMVDGVHFRRGQAKWEDVGWKSAVSNLSDIAAMGAKPLHALVTLGIPKDVSAEEIEDMYRGMKAALDEFGGAVVGGDVVSSPVFFVTVALTGVMAPVDGIAFDPLTRDSAQPGDLIGVTGSLGGAIAGLRALDEGREGDAAEALKRMHFRPRPRIVEAAALIEGGVRCAMDVSDGLLGDLGKICEASEVGAVIDASSVPVSPELRELFGDEATEMAIAGGEDYELLFTAPFDVMDRLLARHRKTFTYIGRVIEEPDEGPRVRVNDANGDPLQMKLSSWDHLRE